ncbi:MAG TPA: hypothetical protein VF257_18825 [Solirubrobacteraceae bacterium]
MSRLRAGEWLAGAGAALLLVSLFLDWVGPRHESGWSALGWPTLLLCLAAIAVAGWLLVATLSARPVAQVVAAAVLTALLGTLAALAVLVRVAVAQPGVDAATSIEGAAYLGLLAALLLAVGGWRAMADERTGAPESAYEPPPARPAPPPVSS